MRLIPNNRGMFKVTSNQGQPLHLRLGVCSVVRTSTKGFVVVGVFDRIDDLTAIEKDMRRKLGIAQGAWDMNHNTLVVKVERGSRILIGGESVGRFGDILPSARADVSVTLSKAWQAGYIWTVDTLALVPQQ